MVERDNAAQQRKGRARKYWKTRRIVLADNGMTIPIGHRESVTKE